MLLRFIDSVGKSDVNIGFMKLIKPNLNVGLNRINYVDQCAIYQQQQLLNYLLKKDFFFHTLH